METTLCANRSHSTRRRHFKSLYCLWCHKNCIALSSIVCMCALSTKFIIDLESKFVKTWGRSLAQPRVRPTRVCLQTKSCQHKTWQIFSSYLLSSSLRLSVPPASCVLQTNGGPLSASVQRWSLRHSTIYKLVLVFEIVKQPFYCVLLYVIFFSHVWINLCSSFTCY